MLLNQSCKKDFLDVQSPSSVDQDFVFSTPSEAYKVMVGNYEIWRNANNGLFYDIDVVGSDSECHPESYSSQARHVPEGLYASEMAINYPNSVSAWANLYKIANRSNLIMEAIAKKPEYIQAVSANKANDWTQLYGEAAVFRAYSYDKLINYFGDVPHFTQTITTASQTDSAKLVSRDEIYDFQISELKRVEPLMYRLGEGGINAERFSRTFAQGLIGKLALFAGGYGLRRTDFNYGTSVMNQIEKWKIEGYLGNDTSTNIPRSTVDWTDTTKSLEDRARSYIDINCAHCHRVGGHCDYTNMRFNYSNTDLTTFGVCMIPLFNNVPGPFVINAGNANNSELIYRISSIQESEMMPIIGRSLVHEEGVQLVKDWINSLTINCR